MERAEKGFQAQMRAAYDEFRKAEELFPTSPDADPDSIKRAGFWAADCAFWLGEFADGATRCEKLRARYQGHVEELEAGRDLYRCCVFAAEAARDAKDAAGAAAWAKRADDARAKVEQADGPRADRRVRRGGRDAQAGVLGWLAGRDGQALAARVNQSRARSEALGAE